RELAVRGADGQRVRVRAPSADLDSPHVEFAQHPIGDRIPAVQPRSGREVTQDPERDASKAARPEETMLVEPRWISLRQPAQRTHHVAPGRDLPGVGLARQPPTVRRYDLALVAVAAAADRAPRAVKPEARRDGGAAIGERPPGDG